MRFLIWNFISQYYLLQNMNAEPVYIDVGQYACPYCSKIFKTSSRVRRHILIHTGEKPFFCPHCKYKTNQRSHLQLHVQNQHWSFFWNSYKVLVLFILQINYNKSFLELFFTFLKEGMYLLQNEPMMVDVGQYACPICCKIFRKATLVRRHMFIHTGEKPFSCTICNYKTNQRGNLQLHLKKKHSEDPNIWR